MATTNLTVEERINGAKSLLLKNTKEQLNLSEKTGCTLNRESFKKVLADFAYSQCILDSLNLTEKEQEQYLTKLYNFVDSECMALYDKSLIDHPREINNKPIPKQDVVEEINNSKLQNAYLTAYKKVQEKVRNIIEKAVENNSIPERNAYFSNIREYIQGLIDKEKDPDIKNYLQGYLTKRGLNYAESNYNRITENITEPIFHVSSTPNTVEDKTDKPKPTTSTSKDDNQDAKPQDTKTQDTKPNVETKDGLTPPIKKDKKRNSKILSRYANTYNTFAGEDILCSIDMTMADGSTATQIIGELQTISYSIHQEKFPIRCLGDMNAKGYIFGPRTIAGSLVFSVFNEHWTSEIRKKYAKSRGVDNVHYLADEMPSFNVTFSCANEYGKKAYMSIYGVTLVNEGQVMSVNDLYIENTYQFYATNIEYLEPLEEALSASDEGKNVAEENKITSVEDTEEESKEDKDNTKYVKDVSDKKEENKIDKNNGTSTNTNGHGNYRVSYEDYMKNLNKIYKDETSTIEKDLKEGTITEDEAEKRLIKAAKAYSEEKEAADKYYGKDNQPEQKPEQKPEEDTSSSEWPNPKLKGTPYENMSKEEFLKFLREARKEAAIKQ